MSAETIYRQLRKHGMTAAGACAMLGNMQAESALKSNIAQRGMTQLSDAEYTIRVDNGMRDFARDSVGYGLCQWTYWSRKQALLDYAHSAGRSVGDEEMQVDFCIGELKASYAGLWDFLCSTEDTYGATSRICKEYERPAANNISVRAGYANQFFSRLAGLDVSAPSEDTESETYWPPRMICEGMAGADVGAAQALLVARGAELTISSVFDARTKNRTMEFQSACNLHADGIIGNDTWTALLSRR